MIDDNDFYTKYARVFNKDCMAWTRDREFNKIFVKAINDYFNNVLKYRGYVFLSDVYEKFGWSITRDCITVGWYRTYESGYWEEIKFTILESEDENDPDLIVDFHNVEDITKYFI